MFVSERIGSSKNILRRVVQTSTVLALTAALTGCFFQTAQWSAAESPKNNTVELVKFEFDVNFGNAGARLNAQERDRLTKFMERVRVGNKDDVLIGTIGRKDTARDNTLASRRINAVMAHVRSLRLRPELLPPGPSNRAWDGRVKIMVGRYVVSTPNCPDWTKPGESDWTNRTSSNLGCANAVNLGLMVADPGDLIRSRPITPGDGQRGAEQVQKYRTGKTATSSASVGGG